MTPPGSPAEMSLSTRPTAAAVWGQTSGPGPARQAKGHVHLVRDAWEVGGCRGHCLSHALCMWLSGAAATPGGGGPLLPLSQETDGAWRLTTESGGGQTHVWNGGHLLLIIASHPISLSVVPASQFACGGPLSPISSWPYPRASGTSQISAGQSGHGTGPQRGMLPKLSQRDQDLYWNPPPIGLGRADQDPGLAEATCHQAENLP